MDRIAKIISWVFHPLFVPAYGFILIYFRDPYLNTFFPRRLFGFFMFMMLINIVAPATSILIMRKRGLLSSIEVENREERSSPILLVIFYYVLSFALLKWKQFPVPDVIFSMLLGMILSLVAAWLITKFWKISIHILAISGILGAISGMFHYYQYVDLPVVCLLILVLGVVGFARVRNGSHSLSQVYAGAILGFIINFGVLAMGLSW